MPRLSCNSNEDRSTAHFYTRDVVIDQPTLSAYALGCSILGGGGGGDTDTAVCFAAQALLTDGPVRVVTLDDLPDDGLVMPWCFVGAPTCFISDGRAVWGCPWSMRMGWGGRFRSSRRRRCTSSTCRRRPSSSPTSGPTLWSSGRGPTSGRRPWFGQPWPR